MSKRSRGNSNHEVPEASFVRLHAPSLFVDMSWLLTWVERPKEGGDRGTQ